MKAAGRRELTVRRAHEHVCGRVVLPEELERGRDGFEAAGNGVGHEPVSIGAAHDAAPGVRTVPRARVESRAVRYEPETNAATSRISCALRSSLKDGIAPPPFVTCGHHGVERRSEVVEVRPDAAARPGGLEGVAAAAAGGGEHVLAVRRVACLAGAGGGGGGRRLRGAAVRRPHRNPRRGARAAATRRTRADRRRIAAILTRDQRRCKPVAEARGQAPSRTTVAPSAESGVVRGDERMAVEARLGPPCGWHRCRGRGSTRTCRGPRGPRCRRRLGAPRVPPAPPAAEVELVRDVAARRRKDIHGASGLGLGSVVGAEPRHRNPDRWPPTPTTSASSPSIAAIVPRTPRSGAVTGSPGASGPAGGSGRRRDPQRLLGPARALGCLAEPPVAVALGRSGRPAGPLLQAARRTDLIAKRGQLRPRLSELPLGRGPGQLTLALGRGPDARPGSISCSQLRRLGSPRRRASVSSVAGPRPGFAVLGGARSAASASASKSATWSRSGATPPGVVDDAGGEAEPLGGASARDVPGRPSVIR